MVDLLSIIPTIYGLVNKIMELAETIHDNREDCKWLLEHIGTVSPIVTWLQQPEQMPERTTKKSNGHQVMSDALMGLKETLERSHKGIIDCHEKKGRVMRAIKAADAAKKLRQIGDDISRNMMAAIFATVACNFLRTAEMHADVKKLVNAVRERDTASISSKLPSLSKQIVEGLPDLPPQVRESVRIYSTSITYQNNDKREANKTMVHSSVKTSIEKNNVPVDRLASLASLYSDGSANKSASIRSVAGQGRQKARSSLSKLVDEVQSSLGSVSIRPSHLQRPMGPGNTSSNKKASPASAMGCTMGRPWVDGSSSSGTAVAWTTSGSGATSGRPRVDGSSGLTVRTSLASKTYVSIRRPSLSMGERTTDIIDSSKTYASIRRPSLSMDERTTDIIDSSKTSASIRRPSLSMLYGEKTTDIIDSSKTYASIRRPSLSMDDRTTDIIDSSKTSASIRRPSLSMLYGERTTDIIDSSKTSASIRRPSLSMLYGNEAAMTKRQNGGSSSGLIRGPP